MKNLQPYGIPHSILFENIFAKTFDQDKLDEDKERIRAGLPGPRLFHGQGAGRHREDRADAAGTAGASRCVKTNSPGIYADITMPVEEGRLYHLHKMNFVGVKLFRTPEVLMRRCSA